MQTQIHLPECMCKCVTQRDDVSIVMEMVRFNKMNRIESNRAPLNDLYIEIDRCRMRIMKRRKQMKPI